MLCCLLLGADQKVEGKEGKGGKGRKEGKEKEGKEGRKGGKERGMGGGGGRWEDHRLLDSIACWAAHRHLSTHTQVGGWQAFR